MEPVKFGAEDIPEVFDLYKYEFPNGREYKKGTPLFKFKFVVNIRLSREVPTFEEFCRDILGLQKRIRYTVDSTNRTEPTVSFAFYRRIPDSKYDDWLGSSIERSSIPEAKKLAATYNELYAGIEDWQERHDKSEQMGKDHRGIVQHMVAEKLRLELLMNTMAHYAFEKYRLKMIPTRYVSDPPRYNINNDEADKYHILIGVRVPKDASRKFIDLGEIEDSVCNGFLRWLPSFSERVATFFFAFTIEQTLKDVPEEKKKEMLNSKDIDYKIVREIREHRNTNFYNKGTAWQFEVEPIDIIDHYTDKRRDNWWRTREVSWGDYGHAYLFLCNKNGQINNSPFDCIKFFEQGIQGGSRLLELIGDQSIWDQKLPNLTLKNRYYFESAENIGKRQSGRLVEKSGVVTSPVNEDWFDNQDIADDEDDVIRGERSDDTWTNHLQVVLYLNECSFIKKYELEQQLRAFAADFAQLLNRLAFVSDVGQMKFKTVFYGTDYETEDVLPDYSNLPAMLKKGTEIYGQIPFDAKAGSIRDVDMLLNSIFMRYPVTDYSYSARKFNKFKLRVSQVTFGEVQSMTADLWNVYKRRIARGDTMMDKGAQKRIIEDFQKKMYFVTKAFFRAEEHPYEKVMKFYKTDDCGQILREFGRTIEITDRVDTDATVFNKIMLLQPGDYNEAEISGFCSYDYSDQQAGAGVFCRWEDSEVMLACTETWKQLKNSGCTARTFLFNKNNDHCGILFFPDKTVHYKDEEYLIVPMLTYERLLGTSEDDEHREHIAEGMSNLGLSETEVEDLMKKMQFFWSPEQSKWYK